jgi:hypothetical protein
LWRRPSSGARRRHGLLADGAQEIVECIWGLRARQNADEFAISVGAARITQDVDSENAAPQLRPQHARSSSMWRIGIDSNCSDRKSRGVQLLFPDEGAVTAAGGGIPDVRVESEVAWSHDNASWYFRKCSDFFSCHGAF